MDLVFFQKDFDKKGKDAYPLIKELAEFYLWQNEVALDNLINEDMPRDELFRIEVDERDKPFFPNLPVEFSVSHSKDYWVCLLSDQPCGVDIQEMREGKYEAITKRFYTERQEAYVKENGAETFYDIWTAREAFGKMTGIGFHCNPPEFLSEKGELLPEQEYQEEIYSIHQIDEFEGYKCAICIRGGEFEIYEIQ